MLDCLFNPRSIAVIGASATPGKVGHAVTDNLLKHGFKGRVIPINPKGGEILGLRAYPSLKDSGGGADLAVIAINARQVPAALRECVEAGVGAAVVISAGFKESGPEGAMLEEEIRETAEKGKIKVLGPNCLGLINTENAMNATFSSGMLPEGGLAFFSQSGALGIAVLDWAVGNNIGFSKFISLGNKADLNETDFIEYLAADPLTSAILGYIENVSDGPRFMDVALKATKIKPVIMIKSGGTEAGARAASSHTGALAGSEAAFNAAFRQTGVIRASSIEDLFETAMAFSKGRLPRGNRLLVLTNAGGPGIIAADAAERLGLRLPQLTKETVGEISAVLPPNASLYNPVDIIGDARAERYRGVLDHAVGDPNIDGMLVILTPQATIDASAAADAVIDASRKTDMPIITSFMGEASVREAVLRLKGAGIANFPYPEPAVLAFKRLSDHFIWKTEKQKPPEFVSADGEKAKTLIDSFLRKGKTVLGEEDARAVLSAYGFSFPKRALAKTRAEASAAAAETGFPAVMKIASPDILHKSDVGGVMLDIKTKKEAEEAFFEITSNARRIAPGAFIEGVVVYEMIKGGREVILGVSNDRTFRHMVMFGLGGIYVEVLKDVSFRILPVSSEEARRMIDDVKTSLLLRGQRGEKPSDIEAVVEAILRLSTLVSDLPMIQELDINPLVVMQKGAVALDARMILGTGSD